jgi:LPS export ABC transporter protein LptC
MKKLILLGILILVFVLGGCSSKPPLSSSVNEIPIPQQKLEDFRLIATEGGVKTWEMEAGAAQIYEKIKKTCIQDFKTFIYEAGELASTLSAQRGILDMVTNNMEATGNVIVRSKKGSTLETEELHYLSPTAKEAKGKFITEEFVKITEPDRVTTGYGLEIDSDLENGRIKRDVEVKVKVLSAP